MKLHTSIKGVLDLRKGQHQFIYGYALYQTQDRVMARGKILDSTSPEFESGLELTLRETPAIRWGTSSYGCIHYAAESAEQLKRMVEADFESVEVKVI